MVGKHKQLYVLTAGLVSVRMGLFVSIKCITGFTHVHLPLFSEYLLVLSAWRDWLRSIYHLSVITHEYKSVWQGLFASILNSSAIAPKQCTSHVKQAKHVSYLQIFSRYKALLVFFGNLDVSCTVVYWYGILTMCVYACANVVVKLFKIIEYRSCPSLQKTCVTLCATRNLEDNLCVGLMQD